MTRDESLVVLGLRRLTLLLGATLVLCLTALRADAAVVAAQAGSRPRNASEPTLTEGPAPATVRSWMPRGGKSLRYVVARFGAAHDGMQLHLYSVPNPHHQIGTAASLAWVDVFPLATKGRRPRRLHHVRLQNAQQPALFFSPMWLEPGRRRGPMVFVSGESDVVLTFPKGFAGPVCVQDYEPSSTSISATDYRFDETDRRGFRVMTETVSGRDAPDQVTLFPWRGDGFGSAR